ncbi:MAG: hypothetical protein ABN482_12845 [Corticimicrobacter sp.]|uniref:hypothetical protein n=1 Tax=Corticimicrobacter sp. TaxID=2678536 RepID=UPI0032DA32BB
MEWLISALVQLLGALSVMVAIAAVLLGGLLLLLVLFDGSGGLILNSVGILEPLLVLGIGNLICLVLNAGILALRRGHADLDWLRDRVVRRQLWPALLLLPVGGLLLL